ncbi:MAG TPA: hypothetical protein VF554_15145 [Thermoanaerobaculia bacterium]
MRQSLRLRASAEAFDALRARSSAKISRAELLKHAVRNDHEPHPRIVREVHQALVEARNAEPKEPTSPLKRISGIFSRNETRSAGIDDVVRRFEQAFVRPD